MPGQTGGMVLSGAQWLEQVFRPAVNSAVNAQKEQALPRQALGAAGARLLAQVEALADTGVLTAAQEDAARAALTAAGMLPRLETTTAWSSVSGSTGVATAVRAGEPPAIPAGPPPAPPGPPELIAVLAGPRPLGRLAEAPVTLVTAELWRDEFAVDIYAEPGADFRAARRDHLRAWAEATRRRRRGEAVDVPVPAPPGSPLARLTWHLDDGRGTEYHRSGRSGHTGAGIDRIRLSWRPAPPPDIRQVTILARTPDGTVALRTEIPLPGR